MALKDEIKAALSKIPISVDTLDKAINFAQELGLLPPGVGMAAEEVINVADKTIAALKKVGAITDEQAADADLKQLLIDLLSDEAEAEKAIDGLDPQDPPAAG